MKKGAIFDLDGTLVHSPGLHIEAWKKLFQRYGIELTENELKEQSGNKNVVFIRKVLKRRGVKKMDPQILSDEKDQVVIDILEMHPAKVFNGVKEFLQLLQLKGVKMGLATSATKQTAIVLGKDLISFFDVALFAEDVEQGKPEPEIFLKTAKKLGLNSKDCIVFEDAESGVKAAKSGKFFCIAKDNGLGQNLSKADVVVTKYQVDKLISYF